MKINIWEPDSDISKIEGIVIVIDVFRAFSTNYFIANQNPKNIFAVDSIEKAFELKQKYGNSAVLVGERQGIKIDGFDFGNSPTEIQESDMREKVVIHTTTAGTRGLLKQNTNSDVICGSFVNTQAILDYIKRNQYKEINLYCTARKNGVFGEEDYLFADYLHDRLMNKPTDFVKIKHILKKGSGAGFRDGGFAPESDFDFCMALDKFNFILRRSKNFNNEQVELEKVI
jgi:2-phosphosulfolactate phosphatase